MKLYRSSFQGHYLGANAIVSANNMESAAHMIMEEAKKHGLNPGAVEVVPIEVSKPGIIYFDNGDY